MRRVTMRELHFGCGESLQSSLPGLRNPLGSGRHPERARKRRSNRKTERTKK